MLILQLRFILIIKNLEKLLINLWIYHKMSQIIKLKILLNNKLSQKPKNYKNVFSYNHLTFLPFSQKPFII